tara:strand:+ start:182 stop:310 length:129 start_codon:yes stop_codon:yes gene_type:complete
MTTLEKAKKEVEKRRQEEKNMLRDMKREIEEHKEYWNINYIY